jgi:hypothetical protein
MKKDSAFQYYIGGQKIEDTPLISRKEAEALWDKHKEHFIQQCEAGVEDAEMALWINMKYDTNYRQTSRRIHSQDAVIKNGVLYQLQPV